MKLVFNDGEMPRDVKDVEAAALIIDLIELLELDFKKITIINEGSK